MLVLLACLGQPRLVEVAVLVMDELHLAVDRKPVGVHVEQTHEDGNHQSAVVEVFVLLDFLYDNHLAVGRCHDNLGCIFLTKISDRTFEEIKHNAVYCPKHYQETPERNLGVESLPQHDCYGHDGEQAVYQCVISFAMYSYFLYFLYSFPHGW